MNGPNNPIGWCDYTLNPITGCLANCPYCYVKRIPAYSRHVQFHPHRLRDPDLERLGSKYARIFLCSTSDFFAPWVKHEWRLQILDMVHQHPHQDFQLLTKFPQTIPDYDYPPNVWLGVTVTRQEEAWRLKFLRHTPYRNIRFVSFEPLLGPVDVDLAGYGVNWVIIGPLSRSKHRYIQPKPFWVETVLTSARLNGGHLPIYMKDGLLWNPLLKEFPRRNRY